MPTAPTYRTKLTPAKEREFQAWIHATAGRDDSTYDMRGYWSALRDDDPRADRPGADGPLPDAWKTPAHPTFSDESIYAVPGMAPSWHGDVLVSPTGRIVSDAKNVLGSMRPREPNPAPDLPMPPPRGYTVSHFVGAELPEMPGPNAAQPWHGPITGGGEMTDTGAQ